ncbi:glycosyltransferase [Candidatus Woesearchaeota archaeon]|jgi:hypothetical protein|nr:glycosyltransferase [Candidatus Paceibacterota bacterium]MBT6756376.1 glycosyltransferase [Candidatus Paceibacterota bacterium]MBT6921329.1 glycosyltransferase [Candidatus Paceibacterota bacterium]MBT7237476.1 glycosyltransferase [Candidatus Woesearchaeota archaeon]
MTKKPIIIIPSNQFKNEVCDFLEQTVNMLSKNSHVYVIDYTTQLSIKEILIKILSNKKINLINKHENSNYLVPIHIIPYGNNKIIKQINMTIYLFILEIIFSIYYFNAPYKIIWMFFPQLSNILNIKIFPWKVIYDVVDIYSHPNKMKNEKLKKHKEKLIKKSDFIFTISKTLKTEFSKLTKKTIKIVPQGFSINSFTKNSKKSLIKIPKNKKNIGFVGQINQRLDFKLLNKLISNNPQWNFVFVGPNKKEEDLFPKNKKINHIINKPNFFWIDKQEKNTIPSIIKQFDIVIIPYDISLDFNLFCYPMKLFEYFYMEKPIISTPIKELTRKKFKNIIKIGKNYKEWEIIIDKIIKQEWPKSARKEQKRLAKENSWENKIKLINSYYIK